jgi:hypothetical protein
VTTLDEVYTFVPGGQELIPGRQTLWSANTTASYGLVVDLTAWWAVQATPRYNGPASWPSENFESLDRLVAEARQSDGSWSPDTAEDLAEHQENARAFRESQLNVIFGQED